MNYRRRFRGQHWYTARRTYETPGNRKSAGAGLPATNRLERQPGCWTKPSDPSQNYLREMGVVVPTSAERQLQSQRRSVELLVL